MCVGNILTSIASYVLPKKLVPFSNFSAFDIRDMKLMSITTDKSLRILRQVLRFTPKLVLVVDDNRSKNHGSSLRRVFQLLARQHVFKNNVSVYHTPLLFVTRAQLQWLATARLAMNFPRTMPQNVQLVMLFPNLSLGKFYLLKLKCARNHDSTTLQMGLVTVNSTWCAAKRQPRSRRRMHWFSWRMSITFTLFENTW